MGMSASTLRLTMLTARLSQLQFQGQQINQQRTMLSNESSALYNSLLTAEVPTAPDPSQFTRIKYKSGNTEIISYGQNASGPYSHNMTIKRPATESVKSQSTYNNINLTRSVDSAAKPYDFIANINGVNRNLSLVGGSDAQAKLEKYETALDAYEKMQAIDSVRSSILKDQKSLNTSSLKEYAQTVGFNITAGTPAEDTPTYTIDQNDEATVALFLAAGALTIDSSSGEITQTQASKSGNWWEDIQLPEKIQGQDLTEEQTNAQNLIKILNGGSVTEDGKAYEMPYDQANSLFEEIAKQLSMSTGGKYETTSGGQPVDTGYTSAAEYYQNVVQPAYSAYQSSCATPGLTNVGEGETLFTYKDDNGDDAYIYLPVEDISEDIFQTTVDTAKVYENQVSYIEGETVAETVNANVTFDEDGLMTKATLDTGEVLTFEVETELDETAYNAAMVEYDYRVQKYEKELSDANAKLAKIQAQDQKLEVQLTQLETEQKAIQTEIDAVKAVRDKSIERSFKTFS